MEFSEDVLNVLDFLEKNSSMGLRKRNDLGILMEVSAHNNLFEVFNNLLFTGSAYCKIYNTLKKESQEYEGYKLLEKEFALTTEKILDLIANILSNTNNDEVIDGFQSRYYLTSHGSLRNIIDIAYDLKLLKQIQNDGKTT
ncbi:MAG: hypothetical protein IPP08_02040 [Chlorobiota bacterium]|nr:hypothetical protein [Chlorobiota bacterium]QQS66976.1 MAG: hypothetical protein IPP08_02040 [Chlorobiota bacterium]